MTHLQIINQTYCEHFQDAVSYGFSAWKASIYFFIHAFFPDIFLFNGSQTIFKLHDNLIYKLRLCN